MQGQTIDIGSIYVVYNLIVGILLMLSSETIGRFAGRLSAAHGNKFSRYTRLAVTTVGAAATILFGGIYFIFYLFRTIT
jgi:hypothetical protein